VGDRRCHRPSSVRVALSTMDGACPITSVVLLCGTTAGPIHFTAVAGPPPPPGHTRQKGDHAKAQSSPRAQPREQWSADAAVVQSPGSSRGGVIGSPDNAHLARQSLNATEPLARRASQSFAALHLCVRPPVPRCSAADQSRAASADTSGEQLAPRASQRPALGDQDESRS
jgi:hypothetical protein